MTDIEEHELKVLGVWNDWMTYEEIVAQSKLTMTDIRVLFGSEWRNKYNQEKNGELYEDREGKRFVAPNNAAKQRLFELRQKKEREVKQDVLIDKQAELTDSTIRTNDSVKRTNKNQWIWFGATLAVAIFGTIATWLTYFSGSEENEMLQQLRVKDSLLQQKETQIISLKTDIDSLKVQVQDSLK